MTKKHGNQKDTSHNIGFAIWRGKFLVELVRIFCNFGKNRKIGNSLAPHRKAVSRYLQPYTNDSTNIDQEVGKPKY